MSLVLPLGSSCPKVAIVTLGCAKNEVDSAHMTEALQGAGFGITSDASCAQVIIINTCSFIQSATEESLEAIFDAANLPNVSQGASLIVAGCMPARYGDDLADELTEVSTFVPCSKEDDIVDVIMKTLGLESLPKDVANYKQGQCLSAEEQVASADVFSYVKISDGCDRFCSFCTIPYIRGRYKSFSYETILTEANLRISQGAREIVLIAQDTGRWGTDFPVKLSLAWLVDNLASECKDTWFRVMYIQPEGLSDDLLDVVEKHDNVCKYFDIPLQHVNPEILTSMNRRGSREDFAALFDRVSQRVPTATLRTTLIAGFPGETDEQFEELCDFIEDSPFDYIGVFPYSREEGTRAYDLPNQVDEDEKADRAQRLRDLADAICSRRIASRVGSQVDVLVEGCEEDGQLYGRAMSQAPDVDGVTYISEGQVGEIVRVTILDTLLYEMEGE